MSRHHIFPISSISGREKDKRKLLVKISRRKRTKSETGEINAYGHAHSPFLGMQQVHNIYLSVLERWRLPFLILQWGIAVKHVPAKQLLHRLVTSHYDSGCKEVVSWKSAAFTVDPAASNPIRVDLLQGSHHIHTYLAMSDPLLRVLNTNSFLFCVEIYRVLSARSADARMFHPPKRHSQVALVFSRERVN